MPPGAKKRKALKKQQQQQQEAIGTSRNNNNGDNLHGGGNDEDGGRQDDRESDSNLSSPGSQGNEQFGGKQDHPSVAAAKEISEVTQGLGPNSGNGTTPVERGTDDKKTILEKSGNVIAVEIGTDEKKFTVEKPVISSYENTTQTAKNVASQDPCVKEITPVADSEVVISEKSEHGETSTHSELVIDKSGEDKEYPTTGLEKENGKLATLPESAAGTSKKEESVRVSEVPLSTEEKRLLLPGPPAVRTSWLSCCGLFDAMTGSDR